VVAGHRQHRADASDLKLGSQPRVGTVDLIAGDPGGRHASVQAAGQHPGGQGRLDGKPDLGGDACQPTSVRILDPAPGHILLPVDQGVPAIAGTHQVDGDLGVLDPRCRCTGAVPPPPGALLEITGLVDDQHRLRVAEGLDQVGADVVADPVVVPHRPAQQVLPSHQGWYRLRARRSSSSSCAAGRPAARTPTPWPAGVAPPGQTGPRPDPATPPALPAIGQGQPPGCALRPPSDLWLSSQHRIINGGRPELLTGPAHP
jgi:hypothetical protein